MQKLHSHQTYPRFLYALCAIGAAASFGAASSGCSSSSSGQRGGRTDGSTGGSTAGGPGGGNTGIVISTDGTSGSMVVPSCTSACTDFPPDPIIGDGAANAPSMFGDPNGAGPCVTEPEDGTLFPNNWLRPRIRVPGASFLKITMHADKEANDLVAYAAGETWAIPADIWAGLASHVIEPDDVTVTVQTPGSGATTVKFRVAPAGAGGSMVFWSIDPRQVGKMGVESMPQSAVADDSYLLGFSVGDESTVQTLKITDVQQQVPLQSGATQGSHCIGCHVGTPDGDYVAFVDSWPWGAAFAGVKPGIVGQALPNYAGATCTSWNSCTGSRTFMQYPWMGGITFSKAHWSASDRVAVVAAQLPSADLTTPWNTDNKLPGNLVAVNTLSTAVTTTNGSSFPASGVAFSYMQHTGDHGGVAFPTWSNDGNTVVYASSSGTTADQDGRLNQGTTDLYAVPYNGGQGGAATAVPGASSADHEEYYPAFSPDDKLIAFTSVPAGNVMYANPNAEIYVVPFGADGAQATRLAANVPPQCSGKMSPGVNNHWPKWSPDATTVNGKTYYWLIFSSNRYGLPTVTSAVGDPVELSQLYITAVVVDGQTVQSYPAIYLWNQPQDRLNTTPAWQNFHIPPVMVN